ncbi:hypothetical protein F5Y03DRAFT_402199 [Xylaria venustula]|nr:hypothetical protein F5Y03DRAFT_402199 [Xylaria venustula]
MATMESIYPFIYYPEFQLVICQTCRYAVMGKSVMSHTRNNPAHHLTVRERQTLAEQIQQIPDLFLTTADLDHLVHPPPTTPPIKSLDGPWHDGIACNEKKENGQPCLYVVQKNSTNKMQKHYEAKHGWVNIWTGGRPKKNAPKMPNGTPWREGVSYQRFFAAGKGKWNFEVGRAALLPSPQAYPQEKEKQDEWGMVDGQDNDKEEEEEEEEEKEADENNTRLPLPRTPTPQTKRGDHAPDSPGTVARQNALSIRDRLNRAGARGGDGYKDEVRETNPFVDRMGWAEHFQHHATITKRKRLYAAVAALPKAPPPTRKTDGNPPTPRMADEEDHPEETQTERVVWESFHRVMHTAYQAAQSLSPGAPVLYELAINDPLQPKPSKPWKTTMTAKSLDTYTKQFARALLYLLRTDVWYLPSHRPPYVLTKEQEDKIEALYSGVEVFLSRTQAQQQRPEQGGDRERRIEAAAETALDMAVLDLCIALLDHAIPDTQHDSVLVSALAAMGIEPDGAWLEAKYYTTILSAFIKVGRYLVLAQGFRAQEDAIRAKRRETPGCTRDEARRACPSLLSFVRPMVRRFLIHASTADVVPTPIDWVRSARAYGMALVRDSPAQGAIDWDGDEVIYYDIRFHVKALRDALYRLAIA